MAVHTKFRLITYSQEIVDGQPIFVSSNCLPIKALKFEPAGHSFHSAALKLLGVQEDNKDADDKKVVDDKEQTYLPSDSYSSKSKKKTGTGDMQQDHYALLGLGHLRYLATEDQIRKSYRETALRFHPDKQAALLLAEETEAAKQAKKDEIESHFKAIQEAYEVLIDPLKRRIYDSTDEFDDEIPTDCAPQDFFKVFGPAFMRNGRWSVNQSIPSLGDDNTPIKEVDNFYNFWYSFKSWREFPHADEFDLEQAESRDHKRWMERQNAKLTEKARKEDYARIRTLVDNAYKRDPRILRRKEEEKPPGPKPWPIIGNLNLIGSLPHRSIHTLGKKYGPIMHVWFGSSSVVVGSSVEIAKAVLKTHDATLAGRPKFAAGKYTTYNYSDITWSQYGPYWRQARRMCLMELFSAKRLQEYEYIRKQELRCLLNELFNSANKTVLLKDHLSSLSLNVISRMVLGKKYLEESQNAVVSPDEFKKMLDELFLLNGVYNIGDFIPWIDFLDLQGYIKRMKTLSKKFDMFMEHVLDEHIERKKGIKDYVAKDMVDVLLQLAEDPTLEVKLERHGVKAFTQDLIAGGTESSAVTVEWAISELLRRPEIFKKATEELDRVIGRERWVEEKDIVNLPYVNAIVKEAMRLHPVAPMLVPRLAREDCNLGGYDIPKGTQVLVNVWTIGRDPSIWDNPNEFQPERFLNKEIDVKGHDYELLPFGAGRRMCPGYPLGLKVIQASLANLLHGFNWRLPDNVRKEDLNMDEIFGLSTPKKLPLETVVEPRLPYHLYSL